MNRRLQFAGASRSAEGAVIGAIWKQVASRDKDVQDPADTTKEHRESIKSVVGRLKNISVKDTPTEASLLTQVGPDRDNPDSSWSVREFFRPGLTFTFDAHVNAGLADEASTTQWTPGTLLIDSAPVDPERPEDGAHTVYHLIDHDEVESFLASGKRSVLPEATNDVLLMDSTDRDSLNNVKGKKLFIVAKVDSDLIFRILDRNGHDVKIDTSDSNGGAKMKEKLDQQLQSNDLWSNSRVPEVHKSWITAAVAEIVGYPLDFRSRGRTYARVEWSENDPQLAELSETSLAAARSGRVRIASSEAVHLWQLCQTEPLNGDQDWDDQPPSWLRYRIDPPTGVPRSTAALPNRIASLSRPFVIPVKFNDR